MELYPAAKLSDEWSSLTALKRCQAYLARFPKPGNWQNKVLGTIAHNDRGRLETAMRALHGVLANGLQDHGNPAAASVKARLEIFSNPGSAEGGQLPISEDVHGRTRIVTTPPLARASMTPQPWDNNPLHRVFRWTREHFYGRRGRLQIKSSNKEAMAAPAPTRPWKSIGRWRRSILVTLVICQTYLASYYMTAVLPHHGQTVLETIELVLYAILFGWISAGFWTAMMGFFVLLRGRDRFTINATAAVDQPIDPQLRTAILMPVCNENVARVFSGLKATYESIQRTGQLDHFDFFILSDTSEPDTRVSELDAWRQLCTEVGGYGRIYYRQRVHRIKRKSGNVADWCRRWGRSYRYMVVLDADSVMSGTCLNRLNQLMEANPNAGIIQTAPTAAGRETLYARIQQFATRVYGPLFTAGLHFWQLGEGHYWGHNAIIRVAPFIRHCALGRLPGRGPLSGEILSHDFVEAALMRRAGWGVWMAYDLPGSYEEMPPSLLDELKRDRRWCTGNLMNFRLFLSKGLHPAHRVVFMTGVMAYLSAPLWFLFLLTSTALLTVHTLTPPRYFVQPYQLFPIWPQWHPHWAIELFSATIMLLFVPKIFAVLLIWFNGSRPFGGSLRLLLSMLLEFLFSALLAPIRMLFHTQFVISAFAGLPIRWHSPPREDARTTWQQAAGRHGIGMLIGAVWGGGVYWLSPHYLWWLAPIVGALVIAIPVSVFSSYQSIGKALRRFGLFLIPEELHPPLELQLLQAELRANHSEPGLNDAIIDPDLNALVCASGVMRRQRPEATRRHREQIIRRVLGAEPGMLTQMERNILLTDAATLSRMHFLVWTADQSK